MTLYGNGRVVLVDDGRTADRLGWLPRRRSAPDPELELVPVEGEPSLEPWLARDRPPRGSGPAALWSRSKALVPGPEAKAEWTYLREAPGLDRYLRAMAEPPRLNFTVGISGLGRVGGLAASALAAVSTAASRIDTLLLHDADGDNLERLAQELASVASWRGGAPLPRIQTAGLPEMMQRSDAFLFAAASAVPPLGTQGDVRLTQFAPNRAALAGALEAASEAEFSGLFLMVSDPVEVLAQTAFHDSNAVGGGAFQGHGLAPERVAGLALGVMWGRALAQAEARGQGERVAHRGVPFGPHSQEVLIFDDPEAPDADLCRVMTEAARSGNYRIRELGFLPYIGPALSSIVLTLPDLLAGREVLASSFVDGVYFGAPCRLQWGLAPTRRRASEPVRRQVEDLHGLLKDRMVQYGVAFP